MTVMSAPQFADSNRDVIEMLSLRSGAKAATEASNGTEQRLGNSSETERDKYGQTSRVQALRDYPNIICILWCTYFFPTVIIRQLVFFQR